MSIFSLENTSEKVMIPGYGSREARIVIVGDQSSGFDAGKRKPFSGPAGTLLEECLHVAGLIRSDVYITNLFKENSVLGKFYNERKGDFTDAGQHYIEILKSELEGISYNVIVAMGQASFSALCNLKNLGKMRGYLFQSTLFPEKKVIPTFHPMNAIYKAPLQKHLIIHDLRKAKEESVSSELVRPVRDIVTSFPNATSVMEWCDYFAEEKVVGFDLEVLNYEISCISFSSDPKLAISIPIAKTWSLEDEMIIWRGIQKVLENPNSIKVVQNGMFDIPFLWDHCGIQVQGEIHDTMIGHSILFPELQKSLGFLGSLYCGSQAYWKNMVNFKSIKEED